MVLQIFLHHLFGDVARAPCAVSYRPEVPPPVLLLQRRVLLLQESGRAAFEPLDQIREGLRRRVLDVHVDVVFTDHALEYPDIFRVADLDD